MRTSTGKDSRIIKEIKGLFSERTLKAFDLFSIANEGWVEPIVFYKYSRLQMSWRRGVNHLPCKAVSTKLEDPLEANILGAGWAGAGPSTKIQGMEPHWGPVLVMQGRWGAVSNGCINLHSSLTPFTLSLPLLALLPAMGPDSAHKEPCSPDPTPEEPCCLHTV